jgi:hypothetical protein
MPAISTHEKMNLHSNSCCCPACVGLECLERPRFFAGQLLTETELNSAQDYVRAKNRLHNRYLHGWGVVCGLEVVCNDCDGFVTVKQGYAIDPCGEDIVLCADQSFDVLKAIRDLCNARRRRRKGDCDPYQPAPPPSCKGVEEHWCITVAYEEKEARPITMLRQDKTASCGCCSGGGSCGCGCHSSQNGGRSTASSCGCSTTPQTSVRPSTVGACEPTRILEGYRLRVIEEPPECATRKADARLERSIWSKLISKIPDDTLFMRAVKCLTYAFTFVGDRLQTDDLGVLATIAFSSGPAATVPSGTSTQSIHDALCRFRQAIVDLSLDSPHNIRCQLLHLLDQITCREPIEGEPVADYATAMRPAIQNLFTMWFQYMLDCFCHVLLPPCAPDPCEDRLILACLTIKDDKIVRICNFSCRHFAGAFPSLYYWMSAVPVVSLLGDLIKWLCCDVDLVHANSPLVNELLKAIERVDPTGKLRAAVVDGNFALPKSVGQEIKAAVDKVSFSNLTARLIRADAINLPTFVGKPVTDATKTLKEAGIVVGTVREVGTADDAHRLSNLTLNPLAARGDKVVVYKKDDKVVGFGPYNPDEIHAENEEKLRTLTAELVALKKQFTALKRTRSK